MPLKFECPKCGRRFTEWGAEKVGFKCPADEWATHDGEEQVELVRVGASDATGSKKPSLKRPSKKAMPMAATPLLAEEGDGAPEDDLAADSEDDEENEDGGEEPEETPLPVQGTTEDTSTGLSDDVGVEDNDEEDAGNVVTPDGDAPADKNGDKKNWDE